MGGPFRLGAYAAIVRDGAVLLVEFEGRNGPYAHLPGGGVRPGETLHAALARELREEACAGVHIGPLVCVWEYTPQGDRPRHGPQPQLELVFRCTLKPGCEPAMPARPDPGQVGLRWVPLGELGAAGLVPKLAPTLARALERPGFDPFVHETG